MRKPPVVRNPPAPAIRRRHRDWAEIEALGITFEGSDGWGLDDNGCDPEEYIIM